MQNQNEVKQIELNRLIENPENPNRMSKQNFEKLKKHIAETGNYESLIVRAHPKKKRSYQIINGHHRAKALKQIGASYANCSIWDVDDDGVRILLSTLNRLGGKDDLSIKIELIKKLSAKYSSKELAAKLPDSRQVIEKLRDITMKPLPLAVACGRDIFLNSLVFFLTDEQAKIVEKALAKASKNSSKAEKKASAITQIAQEWLDCQ
ncbi:MAG: ParB-like nuclease domain protein [Planctomycetes bacterium ADurb.Bin401]|nr:MAG: ParB-like nuclease domain protein [Planctomycetes bacterium ADurb.Bin401]